MDNQSNISGDLELESAEGENVSEETPESKLLQEINTETGRNYQTLEEAKKGIKETYSFIGKMGEIKEKAKKYDELKSKRTPEEEKEEIYSSGGRIDKMEFLYTHPEAKSVVDEVSAIAVSRGISMKEAYVNSSLKRFVEKEKKEQEAANPDFVVSGQRLYPARAGISKEEFNRLPLEKQKEFVEKMSGWYKELPKGQYYSTKK